MAVRTRQALSFSQDDQRMPTFARPSDLDAFPAHCHMPIQPRFFSSQHHPAQLLQHSPISKPPSVTLCYVCDPCRKKGEPSGTAIGPSGRRVRPCTGKPQSCARKGFQTGKIVLPISPLPAAANFLQSPNFWKISVGDPVLNPARNKNVFSTTLFILDLTKSLGTSIGRAPLAPTL